MLVYDKHMFARLSHETTSGLKAGTAVIAAIGTLATIGLGAVAAVKPHRVGEVKAETAQRGQTFGAIIAAACDTQGLQFDQAASQQASAVIRDGVRISPLYDKLRPGDTVVIDCQALGLDQLNGHNPVADLMPYLLPHDKVQ